MTRLPEEISAALARGAEIVTANQRTARALRRGYDEAMHGAGHELWQQARVLAVDSWMTSLWHRLQVEGSADRMLLNRSQEHGVWRTIVETDGATEGTADALASLAMEAWARLCLYGGMPRLSQAGVSTDTRAFQRWAQAFARRCQQERWLSPAQLPDELRAAVERGKVQVAEGGLLLTGFDTVPPALEAVFAAIRSAGFAVGRHEPKAQEGERLLFAAPDRASEMRAAAGWARRTLARDASARIGIIVPGLHGSKPALGRVFREVLAPEMEETAGAGRPAFEFSLGMPLAETPLAACALDLLRWQFEPLPLETVSALLVSPYFGATPGAKEGRAGAEFDAFELRQTAMLRPEVTLEEMIALVERSRRQPALADLAARLRAMRDAGRREKMAGNFEQTHGEWADAFRAVLEAARWTRRAGDSSLTFQALERWEGALDELATLDFDGLRRGSAEALRELERIAAQTIFAPESREAAIQIMGPLEAGGLEFDAVWVLGVDDLSWPLRPATTPLLGWQMQRSLGMPGAHAARDGEIAAAMTARLAGCARTVVFSYAEMGAEEPQRLSPVIAALDLLGVEDLLGMEIAVPALPARDPLRCEVVRDDTALPLFPDRVARGGAQVLQLQAACGFRAFAERRLLSTALETRRPGLDARERGNGVHQAMEAFWSEVRGQEELREMPAGAREALLERCVERAIEKSERSGQTAWDGAYLDTQRKRLLYLLRPWLEQELARPEFAVREREAPREARIGPLRLSLKYDRVDSTEGGDLILDYKTGDANPNQWLSERPDAPQLPLYAVLSDSERLGGVAFAVLRAGDDLGLKGFATGPEVLERPANQLSFGAQVEEWRQVLIGLAEDFVGGDVRVDPKNGLPTCKYCSQRLLCRLDVAGVGDEDDEDTREASDG